MKMKILDDFKKSYQMNRPIEGDIKYVFEYPDKDIIDMCYHTPTSDGLHKAGERELNRRYSTRIYYAALFAAIITICSLLVSIAGACK